MAVPSLPPALRFVQGFLPVFVFALIYWSWRADEPPLWLLALVFVLLVLATMLVVRVLWAVVLRSPDRDDD